MSERIESSDRASSSSTQSGPRGRLDGFSGLQRQLDGARQAWLRDASSKVQDTLHALQGLGDSVAAPFRRFANDQGSKATRLHEPMASRKKRGRKRKEVEAADHTFRCTGVQHLHIFSLTCSSAVCWPLSNDVKRQAGYTSAVPAALQNWRLEQVSCGHKGKYQLDSTPTGASIVDKTPLIFPGKSGRL